MEISMNWIQRHLLFWNGMWVATLQQLWPYKQSACRRPFNYSSVWSFFPNGCAICALKGDTLKLICVPFILIQSIFLYRHLNNQVQCFGEIEVTWPRVDIRHPWGNRHLPGMFIPLTRNISARSLFLLSSSLANIGSEIKIFKLPE